MRYKYIIHFYWSPRDVNGNVYTIFKIISTRSGRMVCGRDASKSNVQGAMFYLNNNEPKQNYYFAESQIPKRQLLRMMRDLHGGFPYIGCDGEGIAKEVKKAFRLR